MCWVSEKAARVPFRLLARTVPVTVPSEANGELLEPKLDGVRISAPKSLPIHTLDPVGSERNELGETGSWVAFPADARVVTL